MIDALTPEIRALLLAVLDSHTYFGEDVQANVTFCASCSGYVAFPGGARTAHTADCPVPQLRRLISTPAAPAPAQEGQP